MKDLLLTEPLLDPIVVIGTGTLGRRIALMMVAHGATVHLYDTKPVSSRMAKGFIIEKLPQLTSKTECFDGKVEVFDNMEDALKGTKLIIEAIPEVLELKTSLFSLLDKLAPSDAILASNSSSYPSSKLIGNVSEERRQRVVNTHFYMPPIQNVVEVGSCGYTDPNVINMLTRLLHNYGFIPFIVRKESIGFIFNRVWAAVKRECLEVVALGISTPEDVDAIYKITLGVESGPFELMDKIGLDTVYDIEKHYTDVNAFLSVKPLELLRTYIEDGCLGIKSGKGFYLYDENGNRVTVIN
ncbi:3-hydroxyacyl-CoA dehydrogenase NAD-binding domain-containing protein [Providencia rettgeri]